jgi:hypothetical protein
MAQRLTLGLDHVNGRKSAFSERFYFFFDSGPFDALVTDGTEVWNL